MLTDKKDSSGFSFNGNHVFAEFYGVEDSLLNDENYLSEIMRNAVEVCGATILNETSHKFYPEGVTTLLLLSESHASIHTYPSHTAAFVDIFTCGDCDPKVAIQQIEKALKPKKVHSTCIIRGETNND
ncbi:adenosylmethionine decarboxylase [Brenneria rubrifaciens]|uniref:S-adenosylmethionine decarboxylase proenzyme n=1 Tax=Brenneria rubrifaciens TaxID=55213 RepID=A0A4P8QQ05_9GAMM|nr:adenosylmethionine decarboxylase [Brenneria rubrifaciens]QCR09207.1 adenosylmethionine decarboxylase [Brenneria rubrifaciens]